MEIYETVLSLLGLTAEELDDEKDSQINAIIELVSGRLKSKLTAMMGTEVTEVPKELTGIVVEISVNRYNRIGSEGASSHTVQGETFAWANTDYFAPYADDINAYVEAQGHSVGIRFI